ncbi:uncharacterized protein SPPG_08084 [Spizellomyces punctatus DAOM BR117]|uniref:THO complex subunit 2 n=1 Tax=Spizellomyces punctatus (strain DAOM BR117) TaxID=645134 RepID=A0A0L0H4Q8_SPIPD|nr:uncharacterized protein SPPG_08084 [Spizellomyces punctatus DAOM BR117]KNC96495.1 hypothetical protein SPPG_08084 [Spizellomyces punctatus DAOM BR117]|eukprot:XP_016604535.1 hypothetical protein SPPG_08084 [Spizellomyces punctatus DAOM BR117]
MSSEYITDQIVKSWETGGSSQLLQTARSLIISNKNTPGDISSVRAFVLELFYAGLNGVLALGSIATFFLNLYVDTTKKTKSVEAEIASGYVGPESLDDPLLIPSILVDVMWLLDQESDPKVVEGAQTERARLVAVAKDLLAKNFIPEVIMRERLELDFQQAIGLIHDARGIGKKEVRVRTFMLYAQTKYNLLREESEGYSKLVTELFGSLPPLFDAHASHHGASRLTKEEAVKRRADVVDERARRTMGNIASLIGYFDIDPNRVLDLILDLFTANIADQWDFFVRLLELSPWRSRGDQIREARAVCGQILGFKFDWYNGRSNTRTVPENLIFVAAIMVKHGLVALGDLYPHLSPSDEEVHKLYKDYVDDLKNKEKTAGRFQAQGLVGTLGDEGKASTATITQVKENKPEVKKSNKVNQKAELAAALLAIGNVKNAFTILERLPRLSDLHPEIVENLCRWMRELISPWDVKPLVGAARGPQPKPEDFRVPLNTISVRLAPYGEKVFVGRNKHPARYRFFYENWRSEIPTIRNVFEFIQRIRMYLVHIGPHLYRDPILVGQLIRIGALHVSEAHKRMEGKPDLVMVPHPTENDPFEGVPYDKIINGWLNVVANYLLPAVSRADPNPANSQGLWKIVKEFPYQKRYALYGEWKNRLYSEIPEMKLARAGCERDCRYIMTRLSKDSGKQSGRQIGKVVHSNPVVAFSYIIKQLESYDNMIPHVVDASRYLTEFEFDILPYCLIEALCEPKTRVEANGLSIAPWLKSLAAFTGQVFKKHGMELAPLLRYLINQLCVGSVHDLIVLQELIGYMSGIKLMEEATENQLDALAGGETLKREAFFWENIRTTRRSGLRLMKALLETGFARQMSILISQRKQEIVYAGMGTEDDNMDLKILAWLNDYCQRTLLQYLEFLSVTAPPEIFADVTPSVEDLVEIYGLDPEQAFLIARPKLVNSVKQKQLTNGSSKSEQSNIMDIDDKAKESIPDTMEVDGPNHDAPAHGDAASVEHPGLADPATNAVWQPGLYETIRASVNILPPHAWRGISPAFYATFWQLSLYDIVLPKQRYHGEIANQKKNIRQMETEIVQLERERDNVDDGLRKANDEIRKKRKEIDRASLVIKALDGEWRMHEEHYKRIMERVKAESPFWFHSSVGRNEIINTMIQYCLQPRCVQSPADAMYCAKFIMMMHLLGTPNIPTASLYDRMCSRDIIHACIFAGTEDEAKNYGLFLAVIFRTLSTWHKNPDLFKKEAIGEGLPGFLKKWPTGVITGNMDLSNADFIEYEEFRQALRKWHLKLCKAILACLQSGEYMQIRNAILVLDRVNEYFPATKQMGNTIKIAVQELERTEQRGDLKQLARSYGTKLQLREGHWLDNREFCRVVERKGSGMVDGMGTPGSESVPASRRESEILKPEEGQLKEEPGATDGERNKDEAKKQMDDRRPRESMKEPSGTSTSAPHTPTQRKEEREGGAKDRDRRKNDESVSGTVTANSAERGERERGEISHREHGQSYSHEKPRFNERDKENQRRKEGAGSVGISGTSATKEKEKDRKPAREREKGQKDTEKDKEKEKEKDKEKRGDRAKDRDRDRKRKERETESMTEDRKDRKRDREKDERESKRSRRDDVGSSAASEKPASENGPAGNGAVGRKRRAEEDPSPAPGGIDSYRPASASANGSTKRLRGTSRDREREDRDRRRRGR